MRGADWWQEVAAIYAAIVATGALALEIRRWFESGARLWVSVMCPAIEIGGSGSKREFIAVTVGNRGDVPTTITHFTLHEYPTLFARLRRKPAWSALVSYRQDMEIPHEIKPGSYWLGQVPYESPLKAAAERGALYVGITAVHSRKMVLRRVRPVKVEVQSGEKKPVKSEYSMQ